MSNNNEAYRVQVGCFKSPFSPFRPIVIDRICEMIIQIKKRANTDCAVYEDGSVTYMYLSPVFQDVESARIECKNIYERCGFPACVKPGNEVKGVVVTEKYAL